MPSNGSWQKVRFDEICKNVSKRVDNPQESEYEKFVGLEHLDTLEAKITRYGSTNDVTSSMTLFKNKQILFGRRNWYLRRVAVADFDGLCSGDIYVLEPIDKKIIKDFLPLLMHSDEFFEKNMMFSHGSMSTRVKWSNLAKLEFCIPSIPQQEHILSITHKIDDTISDAQTLLEKTKNYMVSRRESLLTRGIGHTKFKKVLWYYGKTIEIPEEWEVKKIDDVFEVRGRIGWRGLSTKDYRKNGIILIGVTNISKNFKLDLTNLTRISQERYDESPEIMVELKDILLAKSGATTGKVCIVNHLEESATVNAAVNILRLKKGSGIQDFFYQFMIWNKTQTKLFSLSSAGAQPNLFQRDTKKVKLLCPPFPEQHKIASILSNINEQITQQQSHLTNLKVLRKSVLNSKLTKEKTNVAN